MLTSFSTALSALNANETAINVVGNNLANLNTPGFKASSVQFSDLVSQNLGSGLGETQVGYGVGTPTTKREFSQGAMTPNSGSLTAAVQGDGFFVLEGSNGEQLLTRVGDFKIDLQGNLVTANGDKVIGWTASGGTLNTTGIPDTITLPVGAQLPPTETANMTLDVNLNALADPTDTTDTRNTFQTPIQVVDSRGVQHDMTVTFTKTDSNNWGYTVAMTNSAEGTATCTGTLTFDANGKLTTPPNSATIAITGLTSGADDMSINWNFLNTDGSARFTQYATDSATSSSYQDGFEASELQGISIGDGGTVIAEYANGEQLIMAQLALASVRNPDTLIAAGNNDYRVSSATAEPAIGTADTGGRGKIVGGSLEASAVDIAKEFTNLIVYQRGYQVNSRVITTADEISQEVLNLKR